MEVGKLADLIVVEATRWTIFITCAANLQVFKEGRIVSDKRHARHVNSASTTIASLCIINCLRYNCVID